MDDIIVIVGPTGVGKTKLSIELAKKLNAEIINGDSVAIYKNLDIGSAKPTIEERENIPHHLIDVREVEEEYSVFDYQKDVRNLINEISSIGKRIIIVGGTGLYIKAALYDYTFKEGTTYNEYSNLTNEELHKKISSFQKEDIPHINNRKRLVRLLNKYENNEEITNNKDKKLYPIKVIGLTTSRDYLYERINKRVDIMLEQGLIQEVKDVVDKYKKFPTAMQGLGYKEVVDYINGIYTKDEMIEKIKMETRRYAKRQLTWFRKNKQTIWIDGTNDVQDNVKIILEEFGK